MVEEVGIMVVAEPIHLEAEVDLATVCIQLLALELTQATEKQP